MGKITERRVERLPYTDDGYCKWFENPREPHLTYWAKILDHIEQVHGHEWRMTGVFENGKPVMKRVKIYYHLGFKLVEHDSRTGKDRKMEAAVSKGATRTRVEAQFHFKHLGRVTASRVCAFIWGNDGSHMNGKVIRHFRDFAEFGVQATYKKYQGHHLHYKGGMRRPEHAVPFEVVVMETADHQLLHEKER